MILFIYVVRYLTICGSYSCGTGEGSIKRALFAEFETLFAYIKGVGVVVVAFLGYTTGIGSEGRPIE